MLARVAFVLALASLVAALAAGFAHRTGTLGLRAGFLIVAGAVLIAAAGAVLGAFTLVRAVTGARRTGKVPGLAAVLVGAGFLAVPAYYMLVAYPNAPPIHDISTDTERPPDFVAIVPLRLGFPNPPAYDGPQVAALQKKAFPDIVTLHTAKPPAAVFAAALDTAQSLGFEIVNAAPQEGRVEASQRTLFFGFVDDVVMRLEPEGTGTKVDVRSKSREGLSDLGANAARVRKILAELKARIG
jgi:hypothetical protein